MEDNNEEVYLNMLKQMGISPEACDAEFKNTMYDKLGLQKENNEKKKKRKHALHQVNDDQKNLASLNEGDLMAAADGDVTLGDLLGSLDTQTMAGQQKKGSKDSIINTNQLKKQLKVLQKDSIKNPALQKP